MHTGINSFLNNFIIFFFIQVPIALVTVLLSLTLLLVLLVLCQIVLMTHLEDLLEGPIFLVVVLLIILGLLKVLFVVVSRLSELGLWKLRLGELGLPELAGRLVVEGIVKVFEIEVVRRGLWDQHLLFRVAFIIGGYPRLVSWSCFTSFFGWN